MVVAGGEDAQVVGRSNGSGVGWLRVSGSQSISCDSSLSNIVSTFGTNDETLVANGCIEGSNRSLEQIGEETGMERWLLVEEVDLCAEGGFRR